MTNIQYSLETSEGIYMYSAHEENPDALVVRSTQSNLETLLSSLELAGVEEGRYFEDYEITPTEDLDFEFQIELTKADFCLFFNFEILNYV